MVISVTEAMQIQHKNCSINYNSKHIMKLKEIFGKDKWNLSKVANQNVDMADIANGIKTSLLTSSVSHFRSIFQKYVAYHCHYQD